MNKVIWNRKERRLVGLLEYIKMKHLDHFAFRNFDMETETLKLAIYWHGFTRCGEGHSKEVWEQHLLGTIKREHTTNC